MNIVIQKFGGTSVSTEKRRKLIVSKVKGCIEQGNMPVIVVSAMGRKGEPYATDTLLSLVGNDFKSTNLLAVDLLMSCGEIISSVVMAEQLNKNGINAHPLTGGQAGILTDSIHGAANIIDVNTEMILNLLDDNIIPVVAGFQGIDSKGFITTIGRGGSDVTAAILGAALKANRVEIYTDVDGIMTSDPRIVPNASLIKEISYKEIFQFAHQGAKVIHPRAVEISEKHNIPLLIKNTFSDSEGTLINEFSSKSEKIITGITNINDRVQIRVTNNFEEAYNNLFDVLAENNISLDLINVFPKEKIFTIDKKDLDKLILIIKDLKLSFSYIENCSKLSVIGEGMKGRPGVMAKILKALTREGVEVLQTADSHMTIWCLINSNDVSNAINALHNEFDL
ncbi:aspartokinase [Clostridium tepidiprofundi DSM 19306]|uniref:Aspartokinase n=1 Tax=Clostridium tepidiprofundi DSM 19306 TaxID=1121338 RepID=A0A151B7K2_9CLOT|nr:aspartate kinase [Clostridium tepidiprofundi]KYH35783.1 aspartokinase [Clostridium tepidiprofundi DSM 19306]